jgi:glycosyltransferase XagB
MSRVQSQFLPDQRLAPVPVPIRNIVPLGVTLLRDGVIGSDQIVAALALHHRGRARLDDILIAHRMIAPQELAEVRARIWGLPAINPVLLPPDPRLIDRLGAMDCLRDGLLPWRGAGSGTVIIARAPEVFVQHRDRLERIFGPVIPAIAPFAALEEAVLLVRGKALDQAARTRVTEPESCRNWCSRAMPYWTGFALVLLTAFAFFEPLALAIAVTLWAVITLVLATLLKSASALAALRHEPADAVPPIIARMPSVSVMVPLYREARIAARLIGRLDRIDYPRDLLDIMIVVEADDQVTRAALARVALPEWMRVIVVPQGELKTKPRALNHALDRARGSIIGIYDAEDAPAPDQIRRVVDRFHQRGSEVACLQGVLDFYNPRTNWLSRCFTMEYAAWFRILLPGMARLGLAVPLGGTTLFFRREALESLGGWDAHNVTEDADLGMRLARHGFKTELIDTVTEEEANCRVVPWIKQRSRWLKGYMMTYAVHMRQPRVLLRQLGWWKFLGFQVFFLTTLSQFLLTPVLLSFWVLPLGLPHPVVTALPPALGTMLYATFLWSEAVLLGVAFMAMRQTRHRMNPVWLLAQHIYFPLGALAAYKALWEVMTKPFYWDKTSHGMFDEG